MDSSNRTIREVTCAGCGVGVLTSRPDRRRYCSQACANTHLKSRPNTFTIDGDDVRIDVSTPLHPGAVALISRCDLDLVIDGGGRWAAKRGVSTVYVYRRGVFLHRRVLGLDSVPWWVTLVDHKSGDGLDCRRSNLRPCGRSENLANSDGQRRRTGRFKGVQPSGSRWQAACRRQYLGTFATEEEAAAAYDSAAVARFGEFARTNFKAVPV